VGKSTILEALSIFFESGEVKIETADLCVHGAAAVRIGAVFGDLPGEVVLDATATTTLANEYLLNADGDLEIHKVFDCSKKTPKEQVFAVAIHPVGDVGGDLLLRKNPELKKMVKDLGIVTTGVNLASNVELRRAIWGHCNPLERAEVEIPLDKEDAKKIWDALRPYLPVYALFKSDRPSQDADAEVQDPLKIAVAEAIKTLQPELQKVEEAVTKQAQEVAERTLAKVKEMDPTLAAELSADFKTERKWDSIFKFALVCDKGVPLNKRGSGVRRLVLLNFFRAEAERRQQAASAPGVIYAIEEPETSQHPSNQRLIVEAFADLAGGENTQVLLTTHVPGLAGLLPAESLRYVRKVSDGKIDVAPGSDAVWEKISLDLGILPDRRARLLVCVEGPNDVVFLMHMSRLLRGKTTSFVELDTSPLLAYVVAGGSSLLHWVQAHYLKNTGLPEVHIYDRDTETPPKYAQAVKDVNARGDGSWATLTTKREIENYLHQDAITEALGVTITFGAQDDVPTMVAKALHEAHPGTIPWEHVDPETKGKKVSRAKKRLCDDAAAKMTLERLAQSDPNGEIEQWFKKITELSAF
jgi:putative ATP-dependent endonuclease of the OLD family